MKQPGILLIHFTGEYDDWSRAYLKTNDGSRTFKMVDNYPHTFTKDWGEPIGRIKEQFKIVDKPE